ncbi:MAG: 2-dehydropantoate 2-reductase N-terminal domain-containing protein, partial [Pseudomonadota bacterium]
MNVCVFGVGCIGGLLAARLGQSGCRVRLFDRPGRLDALRRHGLTVTWLDGSRTTHTDFQFGHDAGAAAPDVLFIALKAHQIVPALAELRSLCSSATTVVTVQNGIPWWYFMGDAKAPAAAHRRLKTLDPDGALECAFAPAQLVGCIAYPAAAAVSDSHIRHVEGDRMPVGAVSSSGENRAAAVQAMLASAGFKSRLLDDLRGE